MKTQVALGVGIGYLLGRTHKLRWALTLGAAVAGGRLGRVPGQLVRRGAESMGDSAGLGKAASGLSGPLLEAGKSAATTAIVSRIESLTDRVRGDSDGGSPSRRSADDEERDSDDRNERAATRDQDDEFDENGDTSPVRRRAAARHADDFDEDIDADAYDDDGDSGRQEAPGTAKGRRNSGDGRSHARERGRDDEQPIRRRPARTASPDRRAGRERAGQA